MVQDTATGTEPVRSTTCTGEDCFMLPAPASATAADSAAIRIPVNWIRTGLRDSECLVNGKPKTKLRGCCADGSRVDLGEER